MRAGLPAVDAGAVAEARRLFRRLHRRPETSGAERETAAAVASFLGERGPQLLVTDLGEGGGHGVAAVFEGSSPGPRIMLRAELDGLPLEEESGIAHASAVPGKAHLCGHDGHMAILAAVAGSLAVRPPRRGSVLLLFQPAEETGAGAAAVRRDPRFEGLAPDVAYALHNLPGFELGAVVLRSGTFCCASRGLRIRLEGRTAHAAQPETGVNPAAAVADLLGFVAGGGLAADDHTFATVVGARVGAEPGFGVAAGVGEVLVTLRGASDAAVADLERRIRRRVDRVATGAGLAYSISVHDDFAATVNDEAAVAMVAAVAGDRVVPLDGPFRWSEDFGRFLESCPGALVGLGAGREAAPLHDPAYVFPEALIGLGAELLVGIAERTAAADAWG